MDGWMDGLIVNTQNVGMSFTSFLELNVKYFEGVKVSRMCFFHHAVGQVYAAGWLPWQADKVQILFL